MTDIRAIRNLSSEDFEVNPWAVAAAALVLAGLLWSWERRRPATRAWSAGCGG